MIELNDFTLWGLLYLLDANGTYLQNALGFVEFGRGKRAPI